MWNGLLNIALESCNQEYIFCNADQLEEVTLNRYSVPTNFHIAAVSFLETGDIVCLYVTLGAGVVLAMLQLHHWKDRKKKYGHQGLYSCC